MTTSVLSVPRVDVRLCGSVPRAEMSCGSQLDKPVKSTNSGLSQPFHQRAPSISSHNGSGELWDSSTHHDLSAHQEELRSQLERLAATEYRGVPSIRASSPAPSNIQARADSTDVHNMECLKDTIASPAGSSSTDGDDVGMMAPSTSHNFVQAVFRPNPSFFQPLHKQEQQQRSIPTIEAPGWAVPAPGEARLEPVCDCVQRPVDLSSQAVFRIGRSPSNDVQLLHATSSRRHALLFHHSNGNCYLVDCGSAHGTYVNGVRIHSKPQAGSIVPHKVRRGSMIRFGGEGAPCFMLKSFSFRLHELSANGSTTTALSPSKPAIVKRSAIVQNNTRYNALGPSAKDTLSIMNSSTLCSKRSFDSLETLPADCPMTDEPCVKRMRCSSPLISEQEPIRLVSPDDNCLSRRKRRVTFSDDPPRAFYPNLISPDLSTDEGD